MDWRMRVTWITGRKKALARAIAIQTVTASGLDWESITQAKRNELTSQANVFLSSLVKHGILAQYAHEYRERDDGWANLVKWEENT